MMAAGFKYKHLLFNCKQADLNTLENHFRYSPYIFTWLLRIYKILQIVTTGKNGYQNGIFIDLSICLTENFLMCPRSCRRVHPDRPQRQDCPWISLGPVVTMVQIWMDQIVHSEEKMILWLTRTCNIIIIKVVSHLSRIGFVTSTFLFNSI